MLLFCNQISIAAAASDQNCIIDDSSYDENDTKNAIKNSFHDDSTISINDHYSQKITKKVENSSDYHIYVIKYLENDPPSIKNINDNKALAILIKLCEKDDLGIQDRVNKTESIFSQIPTHREEKYKNEAIYFLKEIANAYLNLISKHFNVFAKASSPQPESLKVLLHNFLNLSIEEREQFVGMREMSDTSFLHILSARTFLMNEPIYITRAFIRILIAYGADIDTENDFKMKPYMQEL